MPVLFIFKDRDGFEVVVIERGICRSIKVPESYDFNALKELLRES